MTVWLWIIGILVTIFLLFQIPLFFDFSLKETVAFRIRFLFFCWDPLKQKAPKAQKAKKKKPKKSKKPKKAKKKKEKPQPQPQEKKPGLFSSLVQRKGGKGEVFRSLGRSLLYSGRALEKIATGFHLTKWDLLVQIGEETAYDTALAYGKYCAGIYPLVSLIAQWCHCRRYTVSVVPDFDTPGLTADIEAKGWIRPGRIVGQVGLLLFRLVLEWLRKPKKKKNTQDGSARQKAEEMIQKAVQKMNGQSIDSMMGLTLDKIRSMADVNTVIGDPIVVDGATIIPVSKVSYGFAAGGSDLPCKMQAQKDLFGGGSGGGVNVIPVGFLTIQEGKVRLLQLDPCTSALDRVITMAPGFMDTIESLVDKVKETLAKRNEEKEKQKEAKEAAEE